MEVESNIYVQETFADIDDEFCDDDSIVEETIIVVDESQSGEVVVYDHATGNSINTDHTTIVDNEDIVPEMVTSRVVSTSNGIVITKVDPRDEDQENLENPIEVDEDEGEEPGLWADEESRIILTTDSEVYYLQSEKVENSSLYMCEDCDYKSARKSNLLRHIKATHDQARFDCPSCGTNFADQCSLKRHIKTAHEKIMYGCEHCDFKSTRESILKEHTSVVHFNIRFPCSMADCEFKGTSKRALRRHLKSKHQILFNPVTKEAMKPIRKTRKPANDVNPIRARTRKPATKLKRKMKANTPPKAEEVMNSIPTIIVESVDESKIHEMPVNVQVFICHKCDQSFKSQDDLDEHNATAHLTVLYKCELCEHLAKSKAELKNHLEVDHLGVSYKCDQCNYRHKKKSKVTEHYKSVHLGVRFTCNVGECTFASTSKFNLKRHIASVHEGVVYKCPNCKYTSSQQTHLQAHIQARHNDNKFKCDKCPYECFTPHGLSQHKKAEHEGIRFNCHLCHYQATQKSNLRNHLKKVHLQEVVFVNA